MHWGCPTLAAILAPNSTQNTGSGRITRTQRISGLASKLPIREKATEILLKLGVWAPTLSHPRPMYALPSPPIRKLYPMSSQSYFKTKVLLKYENNFRIFVWNTKCWYSDLESVWSDCDIWIITVVIHVDILNQSDCRFTFIYRVALWCDCVVDEDVSYGGRHYCKVTRIPGIPLVPTVDVHPFTWPNVSCEKMLDHHFNDKNIYIYIYMPSTQYVWKSPISFSSMPCYFISPIEDFNTLWDYLPLTV